MIPISHKQARNWLQAGSTLRENETSALHEHLSACAACQQYARFLERLGRELPVAFPPGFPTEKEMQSQIERLHSQVSPRRAVVNLVSGLRLAGGTLLLLAVLGAVVYWGSRIRQPGVPNPPLTASPVIVLPNPSATLPPVDLTPTPVPTLGPAPLVIDPHACAQTISLQPPSSGLPERPGGLLGGGAVQSGDFLFDLWLVCDPAFAPDAWDLSQVSEISGLGIYFAYAYLGNVAAGDIQEIWGLVPYVSGESSMGGDLGPGAASQNQSGILFPADVFLDLSDPLEARLEFVDKARIFPGEWSGAVLAFTLRQTVDGYMPEQFSVSPLSAQDLASRENSPTATPPYATLSVEQLPAPLVSLQGYIEQLRAALASEAGWVHQRTRVTNQPSGGNMPDGSLIPSTYEMDDWYLLDDQGMVIGAISRMLDEAGQVIQVSVFQDSMWRNLTYSTDMPGSPFPYLPDGGFLNEAAQADRLEVGPLHFEGQYVGEQYVAWDGDVRREWLFNPQEGRLLSIMVYQVIPDALQLIMANAILVQERVEQPPDEILALLDSELQPYQPPQAQGTSAPMGFDPSQSTLTLNSVAGDDFDMPTFWYGDLYADGYLLGRVDFGAVPGGWCDRSADGSKLAFSYLTSNENGEWIEQLRWLDLHDLQTVHADLPELRLLSAVVWSPQGERLAFSACELESGICGFYVYDVAAGGLQSFNAPEWGGTPPVWKFEGDQVAFLTNPSEGSYKIYILDIANGEIVYQGDYNWDAQRAEPDSPFTNWGVKFPEGMNSFDRCAAP